jgi:uncharacterized membrane protein YfcA
MVSLLIAGAAGFVCGILSGFGIGGGSLLMIWMTAVMAMDQRIAQGINLLYFLPTAAAAMLLHAKHHAIAWRSVLPAVLAGAIAAGLSAWAATTIEVSLLRRLFGIFLIFTGFSELFRKVKPKK